MPRTRKDRETVVANSSSGGLRRVAWALPVLLLLAAVAVSGAIPGLWSGGRGQRTTQPDARGRRSSALFSSSRAAAPERAPDAAAAGVPSEAAAKAAAALQAQQAAAQQQAAAAAAQQAALAEKQREMDEQAAEQAKREAQLEQDQQRLAAERQQAEQARAAAERARQLALQQAAAPAYSGPSSGELVWEGEVRGTTLVTIDGGNSDVGRVVSGALPGVLVMVQPADSRHVGVAATPAPSNRYRRLTLRVQGKGMLQEVIHWSIP